MKLSMKTPIIIAIILAVIAACGGESDEGKRKTTIQKPAKSAFESEIVGTWTQTVSGNEFIYTIEEKTFAYAIGETVTEIPIETIDNDKRLFVVTGNGKFVPIWWRVVDGSMVAVTPMVGVPIYDSLDAATAGAKPDKEHMLTKKP